MNPLSAWEEQRALVDSFTRSLADLYPVSRLLEDPAADRARWASIAEFGWLGASLPEQMGGAGIGVIEEALLFTAFGRHLLSPSVAATTVAASLAARSGDSSLAGALAGGEIAATFGFTRPGAHEAVLVAPVAGDLVVYIAPDSLRVHAGGAFGSPLDETHWSTKLASCAFGSILAETSDVSAVAHAELLIASMLAGIAIATRDKATDYAKIREQFGQKIGAFQAIKHHCANMALQATAAQELVVHAARCLAKAAADGTVQVGAALNVALRAARHNAATNVQIHGGMGFSAECDAHLFVKHGVVLAEIVGGLAANRRKLSGLRVGY